MGYLRPSRISPRLLRIILPAIVIMTGVSAVFAWGDYTDARDDAVTEIGVSAASAARNLDRYLHDRFEVLNAIGASPVFVSGDADAIAARVEKLDAARSGFDGGVMWLDADGVVRAQSDTHQRLAGDTRRFRAVTAVQRTRIPSVQTVHGAQLENPLILIAVPTVDENGLLNGILAGCLRLQELRRLGPTLNLHGQTLSIADPDDHLIVGNSPSRLESVAEDAPYALMSSHRAGAYRDVTDLRGQPNVIVGFATVQAARWLITVSQPARTAFAAARRALVVELGLLSALALGAIGMALAEARRVRRLRREDGRRRVSAARQRIAAARLISAGERETVAGTVSEAIRNELDVPWCAIVDTGGSSPEPIATAGAVPTAAVTGELDATELHRSLSEEGVTLTEIAAAVPDDPAHRLMAAPIGARADGLVMVLPLDQGRELTHAERSAVAALIESAVQAFDRARLIDRDQRIQRRDAMLSGIEGELLAADGVTARARRLVELVVPRVADFATVEVTDRRAGGMVLAARHRIPGRLPATRALRVADLAQLPIERALVASADDAIPAVLDPLETSSFVVVPIRSGGRQMQLVMGRDTASGRGPFTADDREFVDAIGIRAGVAITRARRDEQERETALRLQRSLVRELPTAIGAGVTIGSRYLPGARDLSVGGDWFDAFTVPDGRIAVCVGDVVGHGLEAATSMGRLASALRAIALTDPDPDRVITHLERFVAQTEGARLATAAYVVLDPATGQVCFRAAGHPPPLIVAPGRPSRYLWDGRGAPLGVAPERDHLAGAGVVPPGSTLLLFSDGLFERRGELVDESLRRLAEVAERVVGDDPQLTVDRILRDSFGGVPHSDDVAIVAVRLGMATDA